MATQSQELSRLAELFPSESEFHFPIKQRPDAVFKLPTTSYCTAPKITAEIPADNTTAFQLIASFSGEVLYIEEKKNHPSVLLLRPNFVISASLMGAAPTGKTRVNAIAYQAIDKYSLQSFVEKKLESQDVVSEEREALSDQVISGKRSFRVKAGDEICLAPENTAKVYLIDNDDLVIHPVYFLWKWLKLERTVIPSNHPALEHYDWQMMELELRQNHIYGAISQGAAVENTLGAYNSGGF